MMIISDERVHDILLCYYRLYLTRNPDMPADSNAAHEYAEETFLRVDLKGARLSPWSRFLYLLDPKIPEELQGEGEDPYVQACQFMYDNQEQIMSAVKHLGLDFTPATVEPEPVPVTTTTGKRGKRTDK
jgi:hypothetical protein